MLKLTIPLQPITKKNSQQIVMIPIKGTNKKRPCIIPSKQYKKYERDCDKHIPVESRIGVDTPVNMKAVFYMQSRHKVDKSNLEESIHDILVKYGVLKDDNQTIIVSTDGSRVKYDKENPRTEIEITLSDEDVSMWKVK